MDRLRVAIDAVLDALACTPVCADGGPEQTLIATRGAIEAHGVWRRCAYCGADLHGVFIGKAWECALRVLRRYDVVSDGICRECLRMELRALGLDSEE